MGDLLVKKSESLLKTLTNEEDLRLANSTEISEFKKQELEKNAQKNWERFYKRNSNHFFKDRNWTKKELDFLCGEDIHLDASENANFLICGNTIFPLCEVFTGWTFYGIDFSKNAINLLEHRANELGVKVGTRIADLTNENLELDIPQADLISLIFVLSSISKECHAKVLNNLLNILKPGGSVILRDYAAYDHAMMRFGRNTKINERFYSRQDGTRAYFFLRDEIQQLFEECGFRMVSCNYVYRKTENIKEKICLERIFIEGRFIKI